VAFLADSQLAMALDFTSARPIVISLHAWDLLLELLVHVGGGELSRSQEAIVSEVDIGAPILKLDCGASIVINNVSVPA